MSSTGAAWWSSNARRLTALAMALTAFAALYVSEQLVVANVDVVEEQFKFSRTPLPEAPGPDQQFSRSIHPDLQHISWYLSTFGAAAALNDLDEDGLANDLCYVDTRTDQVIVAPVPGTGERYRPFALAFNVGEAQLFNRARMAPIGCMPGDLDEDGRRDLIVHFAGRTPLLLLSRPTEDSKAGFGAESYRGVEIIPTGAVWVTTAATLADLDGDGHLELVVSNYFADGADIFNPKATGRAYMPDSLGRAFNGGGIRIYRCLPKESGTKRTVGCTEIADALPSAMPSLKGWGLAVGAYDLNDDLLPELYVANDFGPDRLWLNRSTPNRIRFDLVEGEWSPKTPISRVLGRDSYHGMGVDFADLNGDAIPDIFVSNVTSPLGAQEGQVVFLSTGATAKFAKGIAPYVEAGEAMGLSRSGWAWEAKLDDFNNDGVLEALQAVGFMKGTVNRWPIFGELALINDNLTKHPKFWPPLNPGDDISGREQNPFYVRVGRQYVDVSTRIDFGEDNPSRAIATADVDGDGKLDIVVANMWGPSTYYHNECQRCGHFLGLHLLLPVGPTAPASTMSRPGHPDKHLRGRPAIGAAVTVTTANGRTLTRQVDGGNGATGKRSPELHFGLGPDSNAVRVDIAWRDASGTSRRETHQLAPGWHTLLLSSDREQPRP